MRAMLRTGARSIAPRSWQRWWAVLLVGMLVLMALQVAVSPGAAAPSEVVVPWERLDQTPSATRLFAPASGVLYAQGGQELWRSDDAGTSWAAIPLPADPPQYWPLAVHPTDPA